jgi:hypothetical protein
MGNTRVSIGPSKSKPHGGNAARLKLEKPRFLFLEGSGGATVAPAGAAVVLAGTSAAPAGSSAEDPTAGASTPAAGASSRPPPWLVVTGLGDSTSRGAHPPSLPSSSSSSSDDEFTSIVGGGGESLLLAQPVPLVLLLSALPPPDSPLLRACRLLLFQLLRGASGRPGPGRRRIRLCGVHYHPLLNITIRDRVGALQEAEEGKKAHSPQGCRGA